uniref:Uncharacterized protein n=2 Tax=Clastoptera arizonana TaxID=38151 RepID=A0A1B6EBJ6_9HEMI
MTHLALTDCDRDRTQSPYLQSMSVCKKAKQKTPYGMVVVRSCNWISDVSSDGSCVDSPSSYNTKYEYCSICTHDSCNSATDVRGTFATILPIAAWSFHSMIKHL